MAPFCFSNIAPTIRASLIFQGSRVGVSLVASQVVGRNCISPIAPPRPPPLAHDTLVLDTLPLPTMVAKAAISSGYIFALAGRQPPVFFPLFVSWAKIAKINAGSTPVACEAALAAG